MSGGGTVPDKFLVAFSFAGAERDLVRRIAEALREQLGDGTVFYDDWYQFYIAGGGADLKLRSIYGERAELVVYCISEQYNDREWTQVEYEAIRDRNMLALGSQDQLERGRLLPIRVGDGDVAGIGRTTVAVDVRHQPIAKTVDLILNRLRWVAPQALPARAAPQPTVYLAEPTPDLDDASKPINRARLRAFLEESGWRVLPKGEYSAATYQSEAEEDLKQSLAFVQLLGPYAWRGANYDRIQYDLALRLNLPAFRFRSSEMDLALVTPDQRAFLTTPDVVASSFEDFKLHLHKNLRVLAQQRARRDVEEGEREPPLLLVSIRAANPDPLWERVFDWLYEQEQIALYQLRPEETIQARHTGEPCQGFLILCDGSTLEDPRLLPRDDIEQCRVIQMREKDAARRPPVALVYWPPPAPSWAKLLKAQPLKLFRILGDSPNELQPFLDAVRSLQP